MTQQDMFDSAPQDDPPATTSRTDPAKCEFGFCGIAAYRKLPSPPEAFQFSRWERVIGGHKMTGSPTRIASKGPRKGRPIWHGKRVEVFVSDTDIQEEEERFEAAGNCAECRGTGQRWIGWSKGSGNKHKTCEKCEGTGKAKR
jgi:hypothetical protein